MNAEDGHKLEIWMDGECRICQASQAWCELRDPQQSFEFRDFRSADEDELPVDREDHEASMWVRDSDGGLYDGYAAWQKIMAEIPRWRWIARLVSLPPLKFFGPPLYRWIAANRHRFYPG